jgi:RNA polymerase sigma-70 factor (ECF subfamily)
MSWKLPNPSLPAQLAADVELMGAVARAEGRAREELIRRLLPRAQRLCQTLLRSPADAKDACQTALLQVLRSAPTYRGECSVEYWSDRIVTRTALRWMASERRKGQAPLPNEPSVDAGAAQPRVLLRECLNRLSEPQRTTLILRACFEFSVDEIATMTNCSRNTVKDRLTRARQTLRVFVRAPDAASFLDELHESR